MRESVVFYRSFYESIAELPDNDRLAVYDALFQYALDDKDPDLSGVPLAIFKLMKPQVDANNRKYENGKKGGRKKANQNQNETKTKPKRNQKQTKGEANVNDNVNVNDNDNDNGNVKGTLTEWIADIVPENLRPAFTEWASMRKSIKKPVSSRATVQRAYNTLIKLSKSEHTQIRIIEQSIDRCWSSFYELKDKEQAPRYKDFEKEKPRQGTQMPDEIRQRLNQIF